MAPSLASEIEHQIAATEGSYYRLVLVEGPSRSGKTSALQTVAERIGREMVRLWRRHHLDYDQSKYVVEQVRRRLGLTPPRTRRRTVQRLDRPRSSA